MLPSCCSLVAAKPHVRETSDDLHLVLAGVPHRSFQMNRSPPLLPEQASVSDSLRPATAARFLSRESYIMTPRSLMLVLGSSICRVERLVSGLDLRPMR
jgi:hypothetical protein